LSDPARLKEGRLDFDLILAGIPISDISMSMSMSMSYGV
jgi:hypothetical protein